MSVTGKTEAFEHWDELRKKLHAFCVGIAREFDERGVESYPERQWLAG